MDLPKFSARKARSVLSAFGASALVLLASAMAPAVASAQSGENVRNDFSLFLGYMLPNQIEGVTEILPVGGLRYSLNYDFGGLEFEGSTSNAYGVGFNSLSVSYRKEVPLMEGISALGYGGVDLHWYKPAGTDMRTTDTGVHGGIAGLLWITDALWLRSDLKLTANPGTALRLLFGLMFRPSGSGQ